MRYVHPLFFAFLLPVGGIMSLILFALIAGSIFYIGRIVLEFRAYEVDIVPRLEDLEQKIGRLSGQIDAEMPILEDVRLRVATMRGLREDLLKQVEEVKGALRAEQTQNQSLSLEVQKRAFRGQLARGRRLALK